MVKLFCAIVGETGSAFSVAIDESETVDDLKKAIKKEKEYGIKCDADELQLYLAKKRGAWLAENDVKSVTNTRGLTHLDGAQTDLRFIGLSNRGVKEDEGEDLKADAAVGNGPVHVLVVLPTLAAQLLAATKKRKLTDVKEWITPSSFAKCKGSGSWVKRLRKLDGQIECHRLDRTDDSTPIPIVLLNKTFAKFDENCKNIEISNRDCEFVMELCSRMSTPYVNEAQLAGAARDLLTDYLLAEYPASLITPAIVEGSVSDGSYHFGDTLLFNLECKLQKGDGGGDPTMQNVAYYIKTLPKRC